MGSEMCIRDSFGTSALLHIVDGDVFTDTPEVTSVAVIHLALDGLGEHAVEAARGGGVDKDAAVPRLTSPAVFDGQGVVGVLFVGDQMSPGGAMADQQTILDREGCRDRISRIGGGYIGVPAAEILTIEEREGALISDAETGTATHEHREGQDPCANLFQAVHAGRGIVLRRAMNSFHE